VERIELFLDGIITALLERAVSSSHKMPRLRDVLLGILPLLIRRFASSHGQRSESILIGILMYLARDLAAQ
jgi:hypothetical protein